MFVFKLLQTYFYQREFDIVEFLELNSKSGPLIKLEEFLPQENLILLHAFFLSPVCRNLRGLFSGPDP
jgi:hypothetical protein